MRAFLILAAATAVCLCSASEEGWAQAASGAQSLLVDPSIRASGMGRSSNAVFWGPGPNYWSNPALLAIDQGLQYEWGKTQLVPDLADDVFFETHRLTAGYWGLTLLMAGRPFTNVGGLRLDYGMSIATDVDGNVIGTFTSYEETQTFGGAVQILDFAENALKAGGLEVPTLTRFGDIAVGWTERKTHVFLAPADVTQDRAAGEGYVTTHDSGVLLRMTPYNAIDYEGFLPELDRIVPTRMDVSYGGSTQSYNNTSIAYIDPDQSDPIARIQRKGWAARVAIGLPTGAREKLSSKGLGWLPRWITPLIQWGGSWDREVPMIPLATGELRSGTRVQKSGWEVTIANIYSIRRGHIDDPAGTIQDDTSGWGVGFRLEDVVGFSYDRATVPQSIYLDTVDREGFTFFIRPIRIWNAVR